MEKARVKLYPSSAAYAWGDLVITDTNSSCLRYLQLSHNVQRPDIHPKYKEVGDLHERLYEQRLIEDGIPYQRELPFKHQIADSALVSGRVDFKLKDSITECKATFSPQQQTSLNKGYYKKNHLAQLVVYLGVFGFRKGLLHYGYYGEFEGELTQIKSWDFNVELNPKGQIRVNGERSDFMAQDVVQHLVKQAYYRNSDELAPRPVSMGYGGPCHYCPLAPLCDSKDQGGMSKSLMREAAAEIISTQEPHVPKITQIKRKKDD